MILNITQRDVLNLNCLHRDKEIWQRCCRSTLNSVLARLPCYFSKGPLKRDFSVIDLNTDFGVRKFKNTSALRVIFCLKRFKIKSQFRKSKKKIEKSFFCWNKCVWSCCYKLSLLRRAYLSSAVNRLKTVLRFCISLRENFSNSIALTVINKYGKTYGPRLTESVTSKILQLWGSSFFGKCSKLNLNLNIAKKIEKKFFVSEIIASENVAINSLC